MSRATYHVGNTLDVVRTLPDASVDLVLTSPPFLALRSYLPADDPAKVHEIGQEANPAVFVDTLLALTAEWRRVLAPHGSIAIELGDTYSGNIPPFGATADAYSRRARGDKKIERTGDAWPLAKSLALVPELYRIGLAYGVNPLTGTPSPAGRWRVRNVVRWHRPNPPVGALGDKYRPATTDMVVACTSDKRWFDLDAVREPVKHPEAAQRNAERAEPTYGLKGWNSDRNDGGAGNFAAHPAGAPPLDTWIIPTEPYSGAHYATWPRALCVKPIESMCPRKVCTVCGQPSRRIVEATYEPHGVKRDEAKSVRGMGVQNGEHAQAFEHGRATKHVETLGWTDCGHDSWRPGVVLDPFAGSGTTLAVATGCGRDAIGIDLDRRNAELARERIGMFLDVAN